MNTGEGLCYKCHKELRWEKEDKPHGWITFTDYSGESYDGKEFLFCAKCFKEILSSLKIKE